MATHNDGALSTPPRTPPPSSTSNFDVVSHYQQLLVLNPTLTPPIAAIESLISLLSSSPLTTVSETLSLLSTASATLLSSQQNPLPVSAGTDLFQRYLVTSFNQNPLSPKASNSDFNALRNQLITNSRLFVARAKQARSKIQHHALPLLGAEDDTETKTTIITYGSSRVVSGILHYAAEKGRWFNVVHILPPTSVEAAQDQVTSLRTEGVSIATTPLSNLEIVLNSLPTHPQTRTSYATFFLLGTGAILENGAAVSGMGSALIARIAKIHQIPLYIATESYKFARQFPVGYSERDLERMGTKQEVLSFSSGNEGKKDLEMEMEYDWSSEIELVDVTPPELIEGLVTENGMMTPNAVAEELIKLWL